MTKIYTAGEHARVIKSDSIFSEQLGDQTGLVGTAVSGNSVGGVYLKFPHVDDEFYYAPEEVEPVGTTPAPEPVKEYLFREGDHVRFLAGHNEVWTGTEFTVREDVEKRDGSTRWVTVRLKVTKPAVGLRSYGAGEHCQIPSHKLEKFTPAPEPKFKVGDWVKVEGYAAPTWDGTVGKVVELFGKNVLIKNEEHSLFGLTFPVASLVPAEKPWTPKFKVGDYVRTSGWGHTWDDVTSIVVEVPQTAHEFYTIALTAPSSGLKKDHKGRFSERLLKASEKPAEPHWTESKPVGSVGQVTYGDNGDVNRVILKTAEDEWLHLYQDVRGVVYNVAKRDSLSTKVLAKNVAWAGIA